MSKIKGPETKVKGQRIIFEQGKYRGCRIWADQITIITMCTNGNTEKNRDWCASVQ